MSQPPSDMIDLTSKFMSSTNLSPSSLTSSSSPLYPPKSQIKRQKMIYHCKFGEFGILEGQFTEPSGVAVNAQNDIIVADTNNHRFDNQGRQLLTCSHSQELSGFGLVVYSLAAIKEPG